MQATRILFFQDFYRKHFSVIKNIQFTPQQIGIMACVLNGRKTSKIASLLSISPRTVEAHIYHIMAKLECNSRESIIDFIESSEYVHLFRQYYFLLKVEIVFRKSLKDLAKLSLNKSFRCLLVYDKDTDFLANHLQSHLNLAGITALKSTKLRNNFHIVFLQPENLGGNEVSLFKEKHGSEKAPILLLKTRGDQILSKELESFERIDLTQQENYYYFFFVFLKKLLPQLNFDQIKEDFQKEFRKLSSLSKESGLPLKNNVPQSQVLSQKGKKIFLCLLSIFCLFLISFLYFENFFYPQRKLGAAFRSDTSIPQKSVYLNRPELINQLIYKLGEQKGIQIVALIGPGGAGKTSLARQYAGIQEAISVWEVNAESKESLSNAFECLAIALSKTGKDQKTMQQLREIRDPDIREKRIIQFVRDKLKNNPGWLLIFNNVEDITGMQEYFPHDPTIWGTGKVIITTRNTNIRYHKYVSSVMLFRELSLPQKLELFARIMWDKSSLKCSNQEMKKAKEFLEKIPSFPLDVSIAAYYLKATGSSYVEYLKNLNQCNNNQFFITQKNVLDETGEYTKTRYGIISLTVKNLISTCKNFNGLLYFGSMLGSQRIPRDLLNIYANSTSVDNFVYHLNKYSLLQTDLPSSDRATTISFYRGIQDIMLLYLIEVLSPNERNILTEKITQNIENYIDQLLWRKDFLGMKSMLGHCNTLLGHKALLTNQQSIRIEGKLGCIYYYFGKYETAKSRIEKSIKFLDNNNHIKNAKLLMYLGNTYRNLGEYEKAKVLLEKTIKIYEKYLPAHYKGFSQALIDLGEIYRILGDYKSAKARLRKSLKMHEQHLSTDYDNIAHIFTSLGSLYRILGQHKEAIAKFQESLNIYKLHFPQGHKGVPWTLIQLSSVYRITGEYEKALASLQEALLLYRKFFPEDHNDIARTLTHMGNIQRKLGNYMKAQDLLREALQIYHQYFPSNYPEMSWTLAHLGVLNRELGNYKIAKDFLKKSLLIMRNTFPENHIEISWAQTHLGIVYAKEGEFKEAKNILEKTLFKYKENLSNNHVGVYWVLMYLGDLYKKNGNYKKAKELIEKSLSGYESLFGTVNIRSYGAMSHLGDVYLLLGNYEKAKYLLENSMRYYKKRLGKNHLKLAWVLSRLGVVHKELGDERNSILTLKEALNIYKTISPNREQEIQHLSKMLGEF